MFCTVGGRATPVARKARLAAGLGAERRRKRAPSCSISISVSESLVVHYPLQGVKAGIGLQHEDAVETGIRGDLRLSPRCN
jgi:hypothetical protein